MRHVAGLGFGLSRPSRFRLGSRVYLGLGLPSIWAGRNQAAESSRVKSVLLIFQTGAPSQIDTFDPKPHAPEEIRGTFKPIATKVPGVEICEHLPGLAARMDKFAIVRSMTHDLPSHEHATHMMLAGIDKMPPGATHMASRSDWPCYASGLDFVRPARRCAQRRDAADLFEQRLWILRPERGCAGSEV